jgi:PRC-barrel domain
MGITIATNSLRRPASKPPLPRCRMTGSGDSAGLSPGSCPMADIETEETEFLIASNKVEGTTVYNPEGEKLGSIYNFMVDKESGQVEYAVLQFGGFLGIGSDYYPVPWPALEYDEEQGGYVIDVDKDFLKSAPHYAANETPRFTSAYGSEVNTAYGVEYEEV